MSRRDAELVIRAKDEAKKVVEGISAALQTLAGSQADVASGSKGTASGLVQIRDALVAVEKAYGKIDAEADRATGAFERQQAALHETQAQYRALVGQIEGAKAAVDRLRATKAPDFVGPTNLPMLKAAESAYRDLLSQQSKLSSGLARQETSLNTARLSLQQLGSTANAVEAALKDVGDSAGLKQIANDAAEAARAEKLLAAAAEKTARGYREQAAAAKMSADAQRFQDNINASLGVRQAGPSFSAGLKVRLEAEAEAADEAARAEAGHADAVSRLRAQINPLAVIQDRLNRELAEAQAHYDANRISAEELAAAQLHLRSAADKTAQAIGRQGAGSAKGLFLGLKPYELQNLSYQINDVFTQLASGTSLAQTAAQQSGQILQLFPKALEGIARYGKDPRILGLVIILGTLAAAVKRVSDLNSSTREFAGLLNSTADAALNSAGALALQVRRLDEAGFAADDAKKAMKTFVREGLDPAMLVAFADATKNLAKLTGTDLAEAATKLAPAFKGGYEAVAKLDDELNFLEPTQRSYIKTLFDAGQAEKARAVTLGLLNDQLKDGADLVSGDLTDAVKDVTDAWRGFLDWLGRTDIVKATLADLRDMAGFAKYLAENLPGAQANGAAGGGGLPGGVQRTPTVGMGFTNPQNGFERAVGGIGWSRPEWAGGTGGNVNVTPDIAAIVRTVMLEARKGDAQGQKDVAAVILNRMAISGQSAVDTVTAKNQFEPVGAPGSEARKTWEAIAVSSKEFQTALENILPILEGKVADPTKGATLFVSPEGQKAMGREMPSWADPSKMTIERGGHQFFKGGFTTGAGQPSAAEDKRGSDYIAKLREQLALTGEVTDAERVRQAGLKALRDAQDQGLDDATAQTAKQLAENQELSRLTLERSDRVRQLQSDLSAMTNSAAGSQDDLMAKWDAANRLVDDYVAKIDKDARTALPGSANYAALKDQAEVNRQILTQQATMKWFEEQIADLTKRRADELASINDKIANGTLSQKQGLDALDAVDAKLLPQMTNLAERAAEFGDSLRTAKPSPALELFIAKMKSLPTDLAAASKRANASMYAGQAANLSSQRDSLIGQLDTAQAQDGSGNEIAALRQGIADINVQLIAALTNARAFWASLGGPEALAAIATIDTTIGRVKAFDGTIRITAGEINTMLTDGLASGFGNFAKSLADGRNAIESLGDAFRNFASDFLQQISMMILKQAILNLLQSASGDGGVGGKIAKSILAVVKHDGGMVRGAGKRRSVAPGVFANAQKFHNGGFPGLRSGEVPAILKNDEEVLTADDPRHAANGGGSGGGMPNLKIVNVFDAGDVVSQGLNTVAGEKAVLNIVRNNPGAFKAAFGG